MIILGYNSLTGTFYQLFVCFIVWPGEMTNDLNKTKYAHTPSLM